MLTFDNMLKLKKTITSGYGVVYSTGDGTYLNSVYWSKNKDEVLDYAKFISSTPRSPNYKSEIYFYDANKTYKVWRVENGTSKIIYSGNNVVDAVKYALYALKHFIMLNSVGRFVYNLFGVQYL